MSDDIVARLRVWSKWLEERVPDSAVGDDLRNAADEIDRLRDELASYTGNGRLDTQDATEAP